MPTYDYQCEKCQNEFTLILSMSEHEKGKNPLPEVQEQKNQAASVCIYCKNKSKKLIIFCRTYAQSSNRNSNEHHCHNCVLCTQTLPQ